MLECGHVNIVALEITVFLVYDSECLVSRVHTCPYMSIHVPYCPMISHDSFIFIPRMEKKLGAKRRRLAEQKSDTDVGLQVLADELLALKYLPQG